MRLAGIVMVSIEEVWREALPEGTELLAGRENLGRRINAVQVLRARPPGLTAPRSDELILIAVRTLAALDPALGLTDTIGSLGSRAGGIAVQGAVHEDAVTEAERSGLPLFRLPDEPSPIEIERSVLRYLSEARLEWYRLKEVVGEELTALAVQGLGLQALATRMGELTGQAVLFEAEAGDVAALYLPSEVPEPQRNLIQAFAEGRAAIPAAGSSGELTASDGENPITRLSVPVSTKDGAGMTVTLLGPRSGQGERARLIVEAGASAAAIELAREQAVRDTIHRIQGDVVSRLIHGEGDIAALARNAARLGIDLDSPRLAIAFLPAEPAGESLQMLSRRAARVLSGVRPAAPYHVDRERLTVFYPADRDATAAVIHRLAARLHHELAVALPDRRLRVGVSRIYAGPESFRISDGEAARALELGLVVLPDRDVIWFEDLGVYRLLLGIGDRSELEEFCRTVLGVLERYDRERHAELVRTLDAYLRLGTMAAVAKHLHLHRNTLLYRLRRIREIADIDLDDPETSFTLQLALRVKETLRVSSGT